MRKRSPNRFAEQYLSFNNHILKFKIIPHVCGVYTGKQKGDISELYNHTQYGYIMNGSNVQPTTILVLITLFLMLYLTKIYIKKTT